MAYNKSDFLLSSAKVMKAAFEVDQAIAKRASIVNDWSKLAIEGIKAGVLTMDDVKRQLIIDYSFTLPKAEQEDFDIETANIGDCGNTLKGWYYALNRIVKAGDACMERIVKGEALNTVARDTKPVQAQSGKGGGAPKAADKPVDFAKALSSLHYHLDGAIANGERAAEMASNAQVIAILGKLAQLEKAAVAYTKKATAKKAA